jgi:D-lactate dehydrogenase
MKIAVFTTKPYDQAYFEKYAGDNDHEFSFFETALNKVTANLTIDFDAVFFFNAAVKESTMSTFFNN